VHEGTRFTITEGPNLTRKCTFQIGKQLMATAVTLRTDLARRPLGNWGQFAFQVGGRGNNKDNKHPKIFTKRSEEL